MKKHITQQQYEELNAEERGCADSYYIRTGLPKPENGPDFWEIGKMIAYLDEQAMLHSFSETVESNRGKWMDIYGFPINRTPMSEWCDKLWEKVKRMLAIDYSVNKSPFDK
jgi:hypothetical protein